MEKLKLSINGSPIGLTVFEAKTFIGKLKGFMFSARPSYGLLLESTNSIHTFFMSFAIDVLFLTNNNRIVKIKNNLKPWRMIYPVFSASKTLELPEGIIDISHLKIGDTLTFQK